MNQIRALWRYIIFLICFFVLTYNCSSSGTKVASLFRDPNKLKKSIAGSRTDTISINDMKFLPEIVKVNKGDTAIWINNDIVAHCVTEIPYKKWTSGEIPAGGSWKMEVAQSSNYYCSIHQIMKGKIVMEKFYPVIKLFREIK